MNPYISQIKSKIIKKKFVDDKTHIVLNENLCLDYKNLNVEEENILIDGNTINSTYESSIGKVYILNFKPEKDIVLLELNYEERIKILKSLSSRYLITAILKKYFNKAPGKFITRKDSSSFFIENIYFKEEVEDIIKVINNLSKLYIESSLDIRNEKGNVFIDSIYDGENLGPHLVNTSEISLIDITGYKINNNGVIIDYKNQ